MLWPTSLTICVQKKVTSKGIENSDLLFKGAGDISGLILIEIGVSKAISTPFFLQVQSPSHVQESCERRKNESGGRKLELLL